MRTYLFDHPHVNQWCKSLRDPNKPSWVERLLCFFFPYTDIHRAGTDDIYLRRWFLYPRDKDFGKNKDKGRLYLHKFYRGDEDSHFHDHPWAYSSLILTKGYWEETPWDEAELEGLKASRWYTINASETPEYDERVRIFYPRFSFLRRPATWKHRVVLKTDKLGNNEKVWTIVKTGVKERSWGFWIADKICPWRQYDNGNCLEEPKGDNHES